MTYANVTGNSTIQQHVMTNLKNLAHKYKPNNNNIYFKPTFELKIKN